jgi:putative SOS response-associated peptidase YedK
MCGRAACTLDPSMYRHAVSKNLGTDMSQSQWKGQSAYKQTYNAAPTDNLPVVYKCKTQKTEPIKILQESDGTFKSASELLASEVKQESTVGYVIHTMKWGIPVTIENNTIKPVINARSESLTEKPMFKRLLGSNRCVVFIDGYYEWQNATLSSPSKGKSIPKKSPRQTLFICPKDNAIKTENPQDEHELLCLAGLYRADKVKKEGSDELEYYFTVVTLPSTGEMGTIHDRTPAILTSRNDIEKWLGDDEPLSALKNPPPNSLQFKKVCTKFQIIF